MTSFCTSGSIIGMNAGNAGCLAPSNTNPNKHGKTRLDAPRSLEMLH